MQAHSVIQIVLALPVRVDALVTRATAIHDALAQNATAFPSPTPTLVVFAGHIAGLTSAQATALTHAHGAAALRDDAKRLVIQDCKQLAAYVQPIANANPENAQSVAGQAGMSLRKRNAASKPPLAAKQKLSGEVHLSAKAITGAKANDWQYSSDGGKTWVSVPTSTKASTVVTGLVPGSTVMFRHRAITKAGPQDWGQPISSVVT
jgi:hypothetical protein